MERRGPPVPRAHRHSPPVSGKASPLRTGQRVRLRCDDLAFGEDGVCHRDGYVVFVPGILPGETADVKVVQAGRKFARGEVVKILERSPDRVEPRCRHFGVCGGCTWQHMRYGAQAGRKEGLLRALLRHRVGEAAAKAVVPIAAMEEPWGFREKVQLAVQGKPGALKVGFYRLRSHEIVDVEECPVQPPEAVAQALAAKRALKASRIAPFDEGSERGAVRHIVLRRGRATGDSHLVLVTAREDAPPLRSVFAGLRRVEPPLGGASLNVNVWKSSVVLGPRTRHLFGQSTWRERIGGVEFEIGPTTFFQTNARAAEFLVEEVRRQVPRDPAHRVLDLYAGCGLFALTLAGQVGSVLAVEAGREAAADGVRNAERNRILNCEWRTGPVERIVADPRIGRFDTVVADPPRDGMGPGVLAGIIRACRARRLVLVSCDPMTLARDLEAAQALGGTIERVLPVDMFPHTHHLEAVATVTFSGRPAEGRSPPVEVRSHPAEGRSRRTEGRSRPAEGRSRPAARRRPR